MEFDSFVLIGHGAYGAGFDCGAVNKDKHITEYEINKMIVDVAKKYLDKTGLKIQYGENNLYNKHLSGNKYSLKCGVSVHVNSYSESSTGVEVLAPFLETELGGDFEFCKNISLALGISNRGVKSMCLETKTYIPRTNGVAINKLNYLGEIRDAWNRGISLSILECGFIHHDINNILANIDVIGYYVAKYICDYAKINISYEQPKNDVEDSQNNFPQSGKFKCNEKIFFRNSVGVSTDNPITGDYLPGEYVYFDRMEECQRYVWISWVSTTHNKRRFMPIYDKDNDELWGEFIQ